LKHFLFIFLSFYSFCVKSQVFDFESISQEQGLPSSSITSIMQDSRHFMWLGTDGAGLVKYDGNNYTIYDESRGLKGTFITDVLEDENHNLIVTSQYSGIFIFDGKHFFKTFSVKLTGLKTNTFFKLAQATNGVYAISEKEIILIKKDYTVEIISTFSDQLLGVVHSMVFDKNGTLLIGSNNGLFTLENKTIKKLFPTVLEGNISLTKNNEGLIVLSSTKALYQITARSSKNEALKIEKLADFPTTFQSKHIFISKRGTIWLAGDAKQGLLMYFDHTFSAFNAVNGFNGENVSCFMQDEARNLFVGTAGTGLFKTGPQLFVNFANTPVLNNAMIFSVLKDSVHLYVGIRKEGIYQFKENEQGQYSLEKSYINNTGASVLIKNKKNEVIVGYKEGIAKIINNQLIDLKLPFFKKEQASVISLKQDKKNRYFIGTYGGGLFITDENFNLLAQFSQVNAHFADYISTIDEVDNTWYIGTNNGLYTLIEKYENQFGISPQLINDVISVSTVDSYGHFWMVGRGCIYNYSSKTGFKKYTKKEGLTSILIYTLMADKNGHLWSGTNLGIDKIEVDKNAAFVSVKNYNFKNGFKGLETNMRSQCMDAKGDLYFGTIRGLTKCLTNYQLKTQNTPEVIITNIKLSNQAKNWLTENSKNKWVNVPDSNYEFQTTENQLTFQYHVSNTGFNDNFYYSYQLEGNDLGWSNPTLLDEISYSNLPPGNYVFKVKLVDASGKSINKETRYSFSIKAPFYLSWWFILSVLLLLLGTFYLLFNKLSTFNKDFITDQSGTNYNEETRVYLLVLGIVAPLTEVFIELFHVRLQSELISSLAMGFCCLFLYYFSKKNKLISQHLNTLLVVIVLCYWSLTAYKIYFQPFELITFTEYFIILFFSFSLFKSIKLYWIFIFIVFLFLVALFFSEFITLKNAVVFVNISVFIVLINHSRYIGQLNNSAKLVFANNVVNNGSSLTIATNRFGAVSFCSKNIFTILGYEAEEVMGMEFWSLTQDEEFIFADYAEKYVEGKIYVRKLKCKNGSYKYIQWIDNKYSDDLYVGIGQDVTEQINVQEQYRNMVQSATDIIFESDSKGQFIFINNAVKDILGYTPEELLGKHFTFLVRDDYKATVATFYAQIDNSKNNFDILEFPIKGKNGIEQWASQKVNVKRNETGKIVNYSAIVRDITAIKKIALETTKRQDKINQYSIILNELTTNPNTATASYDEVLNEIITKAAQGLKVDRISIWNHFEDVLVCSKAFHAKQNEFKKGDIILQYNYPIYFNALAKGETIIANDVCENEFTKEFCNTPQYPVKSLLDVPIFSNGELVGLICCEMTDTCANWDAEDVNFARSIADVISISIQAQGRKKAEKKLIFRGEVLAAVAHITEKLLLSENIQQTLADALPMIGEATRVDKVYFYENDVAKKTLTLQSEWFSGNGVKKEDSTNLQVLPTDGLGIISEQILANKHFTCITSKLKTKDDELKKMFEERSILSTLILPIFVKDNLCGFIGFDDCKYERVWSEDQLNVIQSLSSNIANAVERITNERLIKESENNFRQINETIEDVFWLFDIEKRTYIYISPNCEQVLGMSQTDFLNGAEYINVYVQEEDRELFRKGERELHTEEFYDIEFRVKTTDGTIKWVNEKSFSIKDSAGKLIRQSGVCSDITEKKKIGLALIESENNFRQINETIQDVFWLYDIVNRKYLYISTNCEEILHVPDTEFYAGTHVNKIFIHKDDKMLYEKAEKFLYTDDAYSIEYRILLENNTYKWINEKSFAIRNELGELIRNSGTCSDITEKKRTEQQLKQLSIVAEKTTNGVLIADAFGKAIWANQGYLDLFEIPLEQLINKRPRDLFNPNEDVLFKEIDELNGTNFTKELESFTYLKNKKWFELNNTVIVDELGNVLQQIEVLTDITEKVKTRNTLLQQSLDLEYQGILQKKIINSQSHEELAIETLGFIQKQTKGCNRISLFTIDAKYTKYTGHTLVNNELIKTIIPINETKSFDTIITGNVYIEKNLRTSSLISISDGLAISDEVISYIIVPIIKDSKLVGSINVGLDHEFDLTDSEIKNLESFTILLSVAIQQLKLKNELFEKNRDTIDSLNYAQNIQNTILPEIRNMQSTFSDVCLHFKPRDIVSGDFYWAKEVGHLTFLAVADCTGHGVPGAFLTLIGSRILEQIVDIEKITDPSEILAKLDTQIYLSLNSKENDIIRDGMEITLCVIDKKNKQLHFAGAGLGLLYFTDDEEYYIKGQRKSIGDFRNEEFTFETTTIHYTGKEVFYMATDGYQDQLGGLNYKRFSKKRTIDLLKTIAPLTGKEKEITLEKEMELFIGNYQQIDDITIVSFSLNAI
jgi:PAS domain S-box-containing protein